MTDITTGAASTFPPRFLACLPNTLKQECPYPSQWGNPRNFSDDKFDPGGKTDEGIIQREYDTYRVQNGLPRQDVRLMTEAEGDDIYLTCYWFPYCPDLPPGLDGEFFDASVNEGGGEAVKILQFSLGLVSDGRWGPLTDAAVKAITDVPSVIKAFSARRSTVYTETSGYTRFGADWERRDTQITAASLQMAA